MSDLKLTTKEKKALLVLFKEFDNYYNANSLSNILGISRVGTMKILKRFLSKNILISKTIGKSIVYKVNLSDDYVRKLIAFLLADEAQEHKQWKFDFESLAGKNRIVIIYGSVLKNYDKAKDIDLVIILNKRDWNKVREILDKRRAILAKPLHDIRLTADDLIKNVKQKKPAIIDTIKTGIILFGQEEYVNIIKNVTSI